MTKRFVNNRGGGPLLKREKWRTPPVIFLNLRVQAMQHAGEGDGFADVFQAADPGYGSLDAHAEAGVGDAAIFCLLYTSTA